MDVDCFPRVAMRNRWKRLGEIIDRFGWPTKQLFGTDGANAAWLIVQHADLNPQFQPKCLDLMAKAPRDEVARQAISLRWRWAGR